jgi:hypothetical protein
MAPELGLFLVRACTCLDVRLCSTSACYTACNLYVHRASNQHQLVSLLCSTLVYIWLSRCKQNSLSPYHKARASVDNAVVPPLCRE